MSHNKNLEEIAKYISGEMSGDEKKKFEDRLQRDPELRQSFTTYKDIDIAIENEDAIVFMDLVKQDLDKRKIHLIPSWWKTKKGYYGIAAVITILITVGLLLVFFTADKSKQTPDLANFFRPDKINYNFRSISSNSLESDIMLGISLFNDKNYKESFEAFQRAWQQDTSSVQLDYYLGLSKIYSGDFVMGSRIMESIFISNDVIYSSDAKWQFIYCCIRLDSIPLAKRYLKEISVDPFYKEKVDSVLSMIDSQ